MKRQGNALAAALNNIEDIRKAYDASENSAGSAAEEQEKYMMSIQYSLDRLSASSEEFSSTFMSSDLIKNTVDGGNSILNVFTKLIQVLGTIPTIATVAVAALGAKGHGRLCVSNISPICPVYC